jgi:septal ring factor EnvC (AmiA/AmiB activator)
MRLRVHRTLSARWWCAVALAGAGVAGDARAAAGDATTAAPQSKAAKPAAAKPVAAKPVVTKPAAAKPAAKPSAVKPAASSPAATPAPAADSRTAAEIEAQLAKERAVLAQLAEKETSLLGRLADLERQIEVEGRSLRAAQARLRVATARLSAAEQKARTADEQVNRSIDALGPRLTARYRLGREGYLRFLLGARSISEVLRRKRLYTALLEADVSALDELRFLAIGARGARDDLATARDELAQSAGAEQEKRGALEVRLSVQRRTLASVQQDKAAHDQAVRELEEAARALSARLKELQQGGAASAGGTSGAASPAGAAAGGAASPGGQGGAGAAASAGGSAASAGGTAALPSGAAAPDGAADSRGAGASPAGSAASAGNAASSGGTGAAGATPGTAVASLGAHPAEAAIRSVRGKLLFPVEVGRIEARFGRAVDPRFGTVTLQRGVDIRAPEGTQVHAVHGGKVVHSGWFKGYGNLVIVDHGGGFFSLYAHLSALERGVGDAVLRGDPLGTVGDTGSLKGSYLYFELRDGQTPLDPERWLGKTRKPGPLAVAPVPAKKPPAPANKAPARP